MHLFKILSSGQRETEPSKTMCKRIENCTNNNKKLQTNNKINTVKIKHNLSKRDTFNKFKSKIQNRNCNNDNNPSTKNHNKNNPTEDSQEKSLLEVMTERLETDLDKLERKWEKKNSRRSGYESYSGRPSSRLYESRGSYSKTRDSSMSRMTTGNWNKSSSPRHRDYGDTASRTPRGFPSDVIKTYKNYSFLF